MNKTVKTDNKLCKKLFTMLLTCSLLLAGIPSAVLADNSSIDFSTVKDFKLEGGAKVDASDGTILTLPAEGASVELILPVKTSTNYTLSFKMKNSFADALRMNKTDNAFHYRSYKDRFMETLNPNNSNKPWGANYDYFIAGGSFSYVIPKDYSFGVERTGDGITFRDVSLNFTTPKQNVEDSYVTIKFVAAKRDEHLAIKDMSLEIKKDNGSNRIFNGDFEAFDDSGEKRVPTSFDPIDDLLSSEYYEVAEEDGNHYIKLKENENDKNPDTSAFNYSYHGVKQIKAFQARRDSQLPNLGSRYKISLKYKVPSVSTNSTSNQKTGPRVQFISSANGLGTISNAHFPEATKDIWETYTAYMDGSRFLTNGSNIYDMDMQFGYQAFTHYIDDLYVGIDESNIGFYEKLVYFSKDDSRYFNIDNTADASKGTDNMFSTEKSIPVESLKELTPNNGYKLVTPRVHYIPTKNAAGGYDVHNITLIAAVYGKKNGQRILHSVKLASDTATDVGKTIDVKIDDVQVPTDGEYTVETMAINMDNMKSLVNKTILTNSGVVVEE